MRVLALAAVAATVAAAPYAAVLNFSDLGSSYMGIGALSGGGGVTRLLIDYPEALQQDILDILFTPKKGASLDIIKVEIGGDTQSTEGTELSHEHFRGDLNCSRGYEWMVLAEAKKRNPDIQTYGLSWGVPGWIGDGNYYSQDNIQYHVDWVYCANEVWGVPIDFMGIWNERGANPAWTVQLRAALDAAGYQGTRLVSADTDWNSVTNDMLSDPAYYEAVDIVGAHYPGQPPAATYSLNKTLAASEMWDLGQVDDWPGAQSLMHDITQQAQWGLSFSVVWCLIYSWFAILPFSRVVPGSVAGAGHSLLTAAEPWSGHYEINPTIHAMAHHTQFAEPGWTYLAQGSAGMGDLPGGGALVTRVNTHAGAGDVEFSATLHTNGASAPQDVVFSLVGLPAGATAPAALHVWFTNESVSFLQLADIADAGGGVYTLAAAAPNAFYSVTTTTGQSAPTPANAIPASAPWPFPYADSFEGYADQGYARYFSDEGGAFITLPVPAWGGPAAGGHALYQLVTEVPIVWETNPSPYTLLGNFNGGAGAWTDYSLSVDVAIDGSAGPPGPAFFEAAVTAACAAPPTPAQSWKILSGAGSLLSPSALESLAFPGQCLGTTGRTLYAGALDMGLVNCSSPAAQTWQYNATTQELSATTSQGFCLDVLSANQSVGARIDAYPCKSTDSGNQQWAVTYPSAGVAVLKTLLDTPNQCVGLLVVPNAPGTSHPFVMISSRINVYERNGPPPSGYTLSIFQSPNATAPAPWTLAFGTTTILSGMTPNPVLANTFYTATVTAIGSNIVATFDGALLANITDTKSAYGMVAVGSGWHAAWFDNFAISAA